MARRPKQQSLLEIALTGDWTVSATYAGIFSGISLFALPAITNPILKAFALAIRPLGLIVAAIFGLIALIKLFRQHAPKYRYGSLQQNVDLRPADRPDLPKAPMKMSDAERRFFLLVSPPGSRFERPTEWSLQLIKDIEWKKFEELSTAYYLEKGIRAEATSFGADGGIDIKLYQDDSGSPTSIVQCKAWNSWQVGVKQIREFLGVMTHEKIPKGFYMTSGEYSDDAKKTATANGITLINGEMLLMMIKRLPEEAQKKLLALATEGDYTTPSCPSCGVKMVKRSGKRRLLGVQKLSPMPTDASCKKLRLFSCHFLTSFITIDIVFPKMKENVKEKTDLLVRYCE
jgi:restriction system protein